MLRLSNRVRKADWQAHEFGEIDGYKEKGETSDDFPDYHPLNNGNMLRREPSLSGSRDDLLGLWEETSKDVKSTDPANSKDSKENDVPLQFSNSKVNEDSQIWTEPWTEPILPHAKKHHVD